MSEDSLNDGVERADQPRPAGPAAAPDKSGAGRAAFGRFLIEAGRGAARFAAAVAGLLKRAARLAGGSAGTDRFDPLFGARFLDGILARAKEILTASLFDSLSAWFAIVGQWSLMCSAGAGLLFALIASIRITPLYLLWGPGFVLLILVLQNTADKFLNAGGVLVQNSPSRLGSTTFLNCAALLSGTAGLLTFVYFVVLAFRHHFWPLFWQGLAAWSLGTAVGYVALHPALINIVISADVRAGEEAIGILSFFAKAAAKIIPIVFGAGSALGTASLVVGLVSLVAHREDQDGLRSAHFVVSAACLPIAGYVGFTLYHLAIDVLRAILVVPRKLDRLDASKK